MMPAKMSVAQLTEQAGFGVQATPDDEDALPVCWQPPATQSPWLWGGFSWVEQASVHAPHDSATRSTSAHAARGSGGGRDPIRG
jgi:hypothetical protein